MFRLPSWALVLIVTLAGVAGAEELKQPKINPVAKQFIMEGDSRIVPMPSNRDPGDNFRWSIISGNTIGAQIDTRTGAISISEGAHTAFDVQRNATVHRLRVRCSNQSSQGTRKAFEDVDVEVVMDLSLDRYGAMPEISLAPIPENIRKLSLNVFMLGRPDSDGNVVPNRGIYAATLKLLAEQMLARVDEASAIGAAAHGRLVESADDLSAMKAALNGILREFKEYPNHPLARLTVVDYYLVDQSVEPPGRPASNQTRRDAVFGFLHALGHLGIEIPFTGCVDREMAAWLFLNDDSDFLDSAGIGDLVEHHYYTWKKCEHPTTAWYVAIGKVAGVLKYHGDPEKATLYPPNYSMIPSPPGYPKSAPVEGPTRYTCPASSGELKADNNHDSSKDNGHCCTAGDCQDETGSYFCSIFEGACSISSDPCPPQQNNKDCEVAQAS